MRAFDAAASGYVRSEGAGLVVLKPLAAALKDNDPIYAVIRGSAVNQNGSSNGLTAPSRAAQEQVLRDAYARAKVSPGQVQFVETQGTGTPLGDAIEALALGNVLREDRPPDRPCAIGSVKTNIGHLEAASGIASLMKAALALKHRQLPPNLHFQTPNPDIPFSTLAAAGAADARTLAGNDATADRGRQRVRLRRQQRARGAGRVAAGGSDGSPAADAAFCRRSGGALPARFALPLLLSARTEKALHALAERYAAFLRDDPPAGPTCATPRPPTENTTTAAWQCWPIRTSRPSASWKVFCAASRGRASLRAESLLAAGRPSLSCSPIRRSAACLPFCVG